MKDLRCPKCGRKAWGGDVVERPARVLVDGVPKTKVYRYREYLHYAGSKKAITLRALNDVIDGVVEDLRDKTLILPAGIFPTEEIMKRAKEKAGSKKVHHYGPV
jgi:hypothetical protein